MIMLQNVETNRQASVVCFRGNERNHIIWEKLYMIYIYIHRHLDFKF